MAIEFLESCLEILRRVPDVVWSGIIASILTLSGVLISNRSNTTRLKVQHAHESREKSKDRLTAARREIYLGVVAEFTSALTELGNMPQLDPRRDSIMKPLHSFHTAAAKVQLIAESPTAELAAAAGAHLTTAYFEAAAKCQPMFLLQIEIELGEVAYSSAQKEIDRIIERQKMLLDQPTFDPASFERLKSSLDLQVKEAERLSQTGISAMSKRLAMQKEFASGLFSVLQPLMDSQVPLLVAMRKELELVTEEQALRARFDLGVKRMRDQMAAVFRSMPG